MTTVDPDVEVDYGLEYDNNSDLTLVNPVLEEEPPLFDDNPAPRVRQSQARLNALSSVKHIIKCFRERRLDLGTFMHYLFYGEDSLRADLHAKSCRYSLTSSEHFSTIMTHLLQPPRTHAKGSRAQASRKIVSKAAQDSLVKELLGELDSFAHILHMNSDDNLDFYAVDAEETGLADLLSQSTMLAPRLTQILSEISAPEEKTKNNCKVSRIYAYICLMKSLTFV